MESTRGNIVVERSRCPYCREEIPRGLAPAVCPDCHALHHRECFDEVGGCAACRWTTSRRAAGRRASGLAAARFEVTSARLPAADAQLLAFSPALFWVGLGATGLAALGVGAWMIVHAERLPGSPLARLVAGFVAVAITCLTGFLATVFAGLLLGTPLRRVEPAEELPPPG